jgi:phosphoribosylglycinamide formyltransferase-1
VAPARVVREAQVPRAAPRLPPSPRVTTDAEVARRALEKVTAIGLALPEVERDRASQHATFRVGQKVFAYFLDNHHGDGVVAVCVRGEKRANARAVAEDSKRYFLPAYLGSRGYLGIRVDLRRVDWADVAARVGESYRSVAPKRLVGDRAPPGRGQGRAKKMARLRSR